MPTLNTIVLPKVKTIVFANDNLFKDNRHMELAKRIKMAREHANLSQEELADKIGSSIDLIRKIEQGNRKTTTFVVKIATACKVRPEWLDDGSGDMTDEYKLYKNSPEAQVFLAMQHMDEATKYQVVKISDSLAEPEPKPNGHNPPKSTGTEKQ